jgi:hypothetical protein
MKNKRLKIFILVQLSILTVSLFFISCSHSSNKSTTDLVKNPKSAEGILSTNMPVISFSKTEHDFGQLIQGEKVSCVFKFTNTGNADLVLVKVSASCGCTASNYSHDPIKPGEESKIEVTFDSGNQKGIQNKTITVLTNTKPQSTVLRIKAQVSNPETN